MRPAARRARAASPIALLPASVFGPEAHPPWFLHRPFLIPEARQGFPVDLEYAPHRLADLIGRFLVTVVNAMGVRGDQGSSRLSKHLKTTPAEQVGQSRRSESKSASPVRRLSLY